MDKLVVGEPIYAGHMLTGDRVERRVRRRILILLV